jgi:hypothetical protein
MTNLVFAQLALNASYVKLFVLEHLGSTHHGKGFHFDMYGQSDSMQWILLVVPQKR